MFPSPKTGEMYHPDSVVNIHKKILKDAGLEHLRFHDFRYTFTSRGRCRKAPSRRCAISWHRCCEKSKEKTQSGGEDKANTLSAAL